MIYFSQSTGAIWCKCCVHAAAKNLKFFKDLSHSANNSNTQWIDELLVAFFDSYAEFECDKWSTDFEAKIYLIGWNWMIFLYFCSSRTCWNVPKMRPRVLSVNITLIKSNKILLNIIQIGSSFIFKVELEWSC